MKRLSAAAATLLVFAFIAPGCVLHQYDSAGWVTLIDGDKGLENFNRIGDANWRAERGVIVADMGKGGHLVSKKSYRNFILKAEFWSATDTNSGIFLRASNSKKVGAANAYEVNIWDIRPDPSYGTGGVVGHAKVPVPPVYKAGGKWNTYEITAIGPEITVKFNGQVTVHMRDGKYKEGPFSLQYGAGVKGATGGPIKWRKVQIKEL